MSTDVLIPSIVKSWNIWKFQGVNCGLVLYNLKKMRESSEIVFNLLYFHLFFTSWWPIYYQNMTQSLEHARKRWTKTWPKGDYNMELTIKRMEALSRRYLPQHDWTLAEQDWWGNALTQTCPGKDHSEMSIMQAKRRFSLLFWEKPHLVNILPCRFNVLRLDLWRCLTASKIGIFQFG